MVRAAALSLLIFLCGLVVPATVRAQQTLDETLEGVANQVARRLAGRVRDALAVAPFVDLTENRVTVVGRSLAEDLQTELIRSYKLRLVERARLQDVLMELMLQDSGVTDPRTAGLGLAQPQPAYAQQKQTRDEVLRGVADQIAARLLGRVSNVVAVTPFVDLQEDRVTLDGVSLAADLTTEVVRSGVPYVERKRLDDVLRELELQEKGVTDGATARKVGSLANADYVVMGDIRSQSGLRTANWRVVDVEIGIAVPFLADRFWCELDAPLLARVCGRTGEGTEQTESTPPTAPLEVQGVQPLTPTPVGDTKVDARRRPQRFLRRRLR